MNIFADFTGRIAKIVQAFDLKDNSGAAVDTSRITVEPPRDTSHGDLATNAAMVLAKPAGRVVYIGLSSTPSLVDSRHIALKDITAVGILSASPGLAGAIQSFAAGAVVPDALVSEVIPLDETGEQVRMAPLNAYERKTKNTYKREFLDEMSLMVS